jgi:hypothetical protein
MRTFTTEPAATPRELLGYRLADELLGRDAPLGGRVGHPLGNLVGNLDRVNLVIEPQV